MKLSERGREKNMNRPERGLHEYPVAKMMYREVEIGEFSYINWMSRLIRDNRL